MPKSEHPRELLRFGEFWLDPATGELSHAGSTIRLQPQPLKLLLALLDHPGELVTRDRLKQEIVADTPFGDSDHAINLAVTKLRSALDDSAEHPRFIDTLPRRGYRFIGPMETPATEVASTAASGQPAPTTGRLKIPLLRAVVLALLAVAVIVVWYMRRSPKLTDRDTVVLAAFTNTTGDPVFDNTLRQGLSAQLQQSPFLNLLSDERSAHVLSLMRQPQGTLTNELAREVCQRTGSAGTIEGSIASLGRQYVLHLRAVNCHTGDLLGDVQATADGKEQVLQSLGKAATKLRKQLGELLPSIERHTAPADDVTTPSLEALQAFSLGCDAITTKIDFATAITLFQRAIELDPNFAMAYARLGSSYFELGQAERAADSLRRAYALRQHVSGREKLYIESHYQAEVLGNLEEARKVYASWLQIYPRDSVPKRSLTVINFNLGQYGNAAPVWEEAVQFEPQSGLARVELVWVLTYDGRLDEAKARAREAPEQHADTPELHLRLYKISFLEHDRAGMEREVKYLEGLPGYRDLILSFLADTAAYGGQFARARVFTRRASDTAVLEDKPESAAAYYAAAAAGEAFAGDDDQAKELAHTALLLANSWYVEAEAALALALAGDSSRAQELAEDLNQRFPQHTIVQFNLLPSIRSAIALRADNSSKALEVLVPAENYDFATSAELVNYYPVYLRGLAYLAAHQGAAAAAEFQKIYSHRFVVANTPIGALAHLGSARSYVLTGDRTKAQAAYQEFLTVWKDADPDTPLLKQARAEYAGLR